jgi:hypothetical protein
MMAPDKTQIAARNYVTALTHNPQMALEYFPQQQNQNPPAAEQARNDFATCLQGVPVPPVGDNFNRVQYMQEFMKQFFTRCQQIEKAGGMVDKDKLTGLALADQTAKANLQILAKNKTQQKAVKVLAKALGECENLIKAFAQRLQQAMQKQQQAQQQNGGDGGKTKATVIGALVKAKVKDAESKQKLAHKDKEFKQRMMQEGVKTMADVASKDLTTAAEIRRKSLFDEGDDETQTE